jgi:hypothetical protein
LHFLAETDVKEGTTFKQVILREAQMLIDRSRFVFLSSLAALLFSLSTIRAENPETSSYAQINNGVGNIVMAEVSGYGDPAAYKNVIRQSISIKDLEKFATLNTRAYLPKRIRDYGGDYFHFVYSVIGQGGSAPFQQHFVHPLFRTKLSSEYLERNEIAILLKNFSPEVTGQEAELFECWSGMLLQLDRDQYSPLKPRYYPLRHHLELDNSYVTMTPKDMRQLSYKYEFKSLKVYVNVYSVKSDGFISVQRGTKTVFKVDPHSKEMIAVEEPIVISALSYKDAELMASGTFTITGF